MDLRRLADGRRSATRLGQEDPAPELHIRYVTMLGDLRLPVRVTHETDRLETLLNLVAAGRGAALVPDWAEELNVEGVVYRHLPG